MSDSENINIDEVEEISHDTGTFAGNHRGFGFIRPDDASGDIFIAARNTNGAFHQDKVRFEIIRSEADGSNRDGKIVQVLEHTITELVGTYSANEKFGFVKPDIKNISTDIFIPGKKSLRAKNNDKVVVHIESYGGNGKRPDGRISEVLGQKGQPGVDVLSIIRATNVPTEFSLAASEQAKTIPVSVSEDEIRGRKDFRNELTLTIDGESTKDYDDAMSLRYENGVFHLGIHIADVTHYVKEGSPIDQDALERGTSVYPVDRVIPMIPEQLSTGICSLVKGEDRLTLSCLMDFDDDGNLLDRSIVETVINVDRRMSYTEVSEMLDAPEKFTSESDKTVIPLLQKIESLTDMLRQQKSDRGAVDFEFLEPEITLDDQGHVLDIQPRKRDRATRIIEELMLKTNETVAQIVSLDDAWNETPLIYRSHETPDPDRIEGLKSLVESFGYRFPVDLKDIQPADIQELIETAKGKKEELLITTMTLRCMKRAMYSTPSKKMEDGKEIGKLIPVGHFGLASKYYCHFTSPIRRYPDLINHRIIKENLEGRLTDAEKRRYKKILPDMAQHICETEHRAIDTERDTNKIKMAEFMHEREGQEFTGVISGMAAWGIYVALPNSVEGMVPLNSLTDGTYIYDEERMVMARETGGREFHIGDPVKVRVTDANPELRIIDFEFV